MRKSSNCLLVATHKIAHCCRIADSAVDHAPSEAQKKGCKEARSKGESSIAFLTLRTSSEGPNLRMPTAEISAISANVKMHRIRDTLAITQAALWPTLEIVISLARKMFVLLLQKLRPQVAFQLRLRVLALLPARAHTVLAKRPRHGPAHSREDRTRLTSTLNKPR